MALLAGDECHPQFQGDFPASDGSAHAAWQGQSGSGRSAQGLSPGGNHWRSMSLRSPQTPQPGGPPWEHTWMRRCFSVAAQDGSSVHLWHLLISHEGLGFRFCVKVPRRSQGREKCVSQSWLCPTSPLLLSPASKKPQTFSGL